MLGKIRKIHFVGIGGIGMSGIAEVLLNLGFAVSGSDIKATPVTERLAGLGARVSEGHAPASVRDAQVVVVEADESDRSFLYLYPALAVVTNIDREHLDHYRDLEEIASAFLSFMNKVPFYGAVIACFDPPWRSELERLVPQLRRRLVSYGIEPGADVTCAGVELERRGSNFEARVKGTPLGRVRLNVPGRHNVQNALAAVAVGLELDLSAAQIREGLEHFRGADRRFQIKAELNGVMVVDDYGHHPTEIRATLDAARLQGP